MTEALVEIVTTLTMIDDQTARAHLDTAGPSPEHHVALENLHNLLRQLPAHHTIAIRDRDLPGQIPSRL